MDFSGFLKGEDITVLKNGNVLGGIISVETEEKNTVYQSKEFLSDTAVYEYSTKSYFVTLEMYISDDGFFLETDSIDLLEIKTDTNTARFYNGKVKSAWCRNEAGKRTVLKLVLVCRKREVE